MRQVLRPRECSHLTSRVLQILDFVQLAAIGLAQVLTRSDLRSLRPPVDDLLPIAATGLNKPDPLL